MKRKCFLGVLGIAVLLFNVSGASAVTVYFPELDISGAAAEGIMASAQAEVTSGVGYIDILLTNTSPLGPVLANPNKRANPFIMEIEIAFDSGLTLNESASYVSSLSSTYFAQGKTGNSNNPATQLGVMNLDYNFVAPDSHGMDTCFMTGDADNVSNNNTVASMNVLDGSYVPQEYYAQGFLNTQPNDNSGAVFDSALFHFAFDEAVTPDASFYLTSDTLFVKYIGGGDYSMHQASVPEPSTVALLGLGALVLLKKRKR
ncbi:MAG: PEP-CTERM sorting domain-containing protein [Planctomycetota bacterium]|jgi:hypothetical protein